MSVHATRWAWDQEVGHPTRKLVLVALADHANSDGECWPSMGTVAKFAECSARTVQRHIDSLCEQGLVAKVSRRTRGDGTFGPWQYRLPMSTGHTRPADTDVRRTPTDCPVDTGDHVQRTRVSSQNHQGNHQEPLLAAPKQKPAKTKRRDLLFEAVCEACGINWRNGLGKISRGPVNAAVKDLRTMSAEPDDVPRRAAEFEKRYDVPLTPTALAKHWPALGSNGSGQARRREVPCDECGNLNRRDGVLTCNHEVSA